MANSIRIGWLDPSVNSRNTGDQIIADAVSRELAQTLAEVELVRLPTQTFLSRSERSLVRTCDKFIVGGTNILNGNIPRYIQWKLDPGTYTAYKDRVSTMGVGWWQYQPAVNRISRRVWKGLLNAGTNSVRDTYTVERLGEIGVHAINTSCPTVWQLPSKLAFSSATPSRVLMTITDYHKNPARDSSLIRGLQERYDEVLIWPQGARDREYLSNIGEDLKFIGPSLKDFDDALSSGDVDYVGTRLHAGIRALQFGVRSTILAIDNRATEISRDIGLPVMSNSLTVSDWEQVENRKPVHLTIPHAAIGKWKENLVNWSVN